MSTVAVFGSFVLARQDGAQAVLRDHWVLLERRRIAAVQATRPAAETVFDRPGQFVLPGLMNLHNTASARRWPGPIRRTATGGASTAASSIPC